MSGVLALEVLAESGPALVPMLQLEGGDHKGWRGWRRTVLQPRTAPANGSLTALACTASRLQGPLSESEKDEDIIFQPQHIRWEKIPYLACTVILSGRDGEVSNY